MAHITNLHLRQACLRIHLVALLVMVALSITAIAQTTQWTRQFGSSGSDEAHAVAVNATGVYVVGFTEGALPGQTMAKFTDAFARKYDAGGNEQWTRQFGTASGTFGYGAAVNATSLYIVGETYDALPEQTSSGDTDAFVRKYDANGKELWTRQFGSSDLDFGRGVAVDANGVYVVGYTRGALPGQTS